MLKKLILLFACLAMTAGAFGADGPNVKVKLATLAPKGSSFHQLLQEMGEEWRKASGGAVTTIFYTDGVMGGESDMVRRMRVGQIQASMLTVGGLSDIDASTRALQNMPMVFRSLDEVDYVRQKLQPMMEKRIAEKGFVVLFWGDAGWVRFFAKKPAIRPDDFKNLKIFAWSGDNDQIDIMKAAGYQPVPLEYTDTLTGLQTGLIDAVPTIPFYALAGQFYGPAPHMLELNWAPLVGATVINKKTWDSFPPAWQEAFLKIAAQTGEKIKAKSRAEMMESVEAMKKRGLQVHAFTPEIEVEWRKVLENVYPKIRGKLVPADMFDEVQRLLKEYRDADGKPKS